MQQESNALTAVSEAASGAPTPSNQNLRRRFGFRIGGFHFLVEEGMYCQLLVNPVITSLPNSPAHYVGLINIHGNIIPTYSLSNFIGLAREKTKYVYLIGPTQSGAALLVDDTPRLIDLHNDDELQQLPRNLPPIIENSVEFAVGSGAACWLSLRHDKLFELLAKPL